MQFFPFDNPNAEFRIALLRSDGVSAPNSTVTLPDSFTITSSSEQSVGRNEDIITTWDHGLDGATIDILYYMFCKNREGYTIAYSTMQKTVSDTGQTSINASELLDTIEDITSTYNGCDVDISIHRSNYGSLDPNYEAGGYLVASQLRSTSVLIAAVQ